MSAREPSLAKKRRPVFKVGDDAALERSSSSRPIPNFGLPIQCRAVVPNPTADSSDIGDESHVTPDHHGLDLREKRIPPTIDRSIGQQYAESRKATGTRQDPINLDSSPSSHDTISILSNSDSTNLTDSNTVVGPPATRCTFQIAPSVPPSVSAKLATPLDKLALIEARREEYGGPVPGRTLEPLDAADRRELFWALYPSLKYHVLPRYERTLDLRLDLSYNASIQRLANMVGLTAATVPQIGKNGWFDLMEDWDLAWFDRDFDHRRRKEHRSKTMTVEQRFAAKERSRPIFVNTNPEYRHELSQWQAGKNFWTGSRVYVTLDTAGQLVICRRPD